MTEIDNGRSLKVIIRKREEVRASCPPSQGSEALKLGRQARLCARHGCHTPLPQDSLDAQVYIRLLSCFWVWTGYLGHYSVLDLIGRMPAPRR